MKKLVAAIAVLTSGTVSAFDYRSGEELDVDINSLPPVEKKVEEDRSFCEMMQNLAYQIMENRQKGVPMMTQYKTVSHIDLLKSLVIAAYDQPKFSTTSYRLNITQEFADETFKVCVESGHE